MLLSNLQRFKLITSLSPIIITLVLCFSHIVNAAPHQASHKMNQHAPIGVMGDHMHMKGEWMFSYRRMTMTMEDNIQGDQAISANDILQEYNMAPLKMNTTMDMLGAMYAPSDKLTLMLMVNYLEKEMDSTMGMGMFRNTKSSGWGDTKISALISLHNGNSHGLHVNLGASIPTGSTTKSNNMGMRLAYPMQLGSGTYDLEPGITYNGKNDFLKWGGQIKGVFRLSDNDEGYTLGDQVTASSWASYRVNPWLATAVRLTYTDTKNIDGIDGSIASGMSPPARRNNYGGDRLDVSIGVTLLGTKPEHRGHQIGIEYTTTVDQDANGIQMEMQDMLNIGYQFAL